jgi:hypothetical protein
MEHQGYQPIAGGSGGGGGGGRVGAGAPAGSRGLGGAEVPPVVPGVPQGWSQGPLRRGGPGTTTWLV